MTVPLIQPSNFWYCPNGCGKEDVTHEARPHSRFHPCPRMRGLTVPMLQRGVKGKMELFEREDYIGKEMVQLDPERGRPVTQVVTTRDDGQDATVYAPTATARGD